MDAISFLRHCEMLIDKYMSKSSYSLKRVISLISGEWISCIVCIDKFGTQLHLYLQPHELRASTSPLCYPKTYINSLRYAKSVISFMLAWYKKRQYFNSRCFTLSDHGAIYSKLDITGTISGDPSKKDMFSNYAQTGRANNLRYLWGPRL